MKFLKSILMGTGGVVLAGLILALLAPKAVHAIAATAVQVVNTTANPAITEDTSRQASQNVSLGGFTEVNQLTGPFYSIGADESLNSAVYTVPAGQTLIITSVDVDPGLGVTSSQVVGLGNSSNPPQISRRLAIGKWRGCLEIARNVVES